MNKQKTFANTVYKKLLVLASTKLIARLPASDFPSENPRPQTRNFPYTYTLYNIYQTMKIRVLITLFLVIISCKNVTEKETEQVKIVIDSSGLKINTTEKLSENLKLTSFLENPIDLQEFKKKKKRDVTTSVTNGTGYYLNPKINDSIFYVYYYPTENFDDPRNVDQIVVFKNGKNKHKYEDETEILIELRIFNKDSDLEKANLIGLSKTELETQFGSDYLTFDNLIVYSNKNKVLILELENSVVESFNYIKLNTDRIDSDLIGQIIN